MTSLRLVALWLLVAFVFSEKADCAQFAFQITFTDKNNTPFNFSDPLAYLSARSLARRSNQGIALDSTDLPVNPAYVDSVINITGGVFHETSKWLNMCMILLDTADSSHIMLLAGKPFIKNIVMVGYYDVDLHYRLSNSHQSQTASTQKTSSGGDAAYYGATFDQTQLVNGNYLHDQGYNGEGKLIAVFDDGFIGADPASGNLAFDSMWANGQVVDSFDFTFKNTNVFYQAGHGADVLSTIAGYLPGTFVGAAPKAMFALYITEYDLEDNDQPLELDNMICGAERADSVGADVITESLGYDVLACPAPFNFNYGETFDSLDGKTTVAARAANFATSKGMLFVATAGNDGAPPIPGWGQHILTPGDADSALTIGAVDISGNIADFSGYGPNAAGQVKPDVCAVGAPATIYVPGMVSSEPGTSFSTPQVAGFATCLWQANPTATPSHLKQVIRECASSYTSPQAQLGYGVANFECAQIVLDVKDTPPPFTGYNWVIIHPNPVTNNILHISASPNISQDVGFRLVDMQGREAVFVSQYMYQGINNSLVLAVPELPAGIYTLKAVSATQQQVIKIEKE